ncbi:hypothetical protein VTL71DRAFT_221 [Oculimacula yallundae]|uniref:Uncharacterized protein n=1 Tax=Oculimacula yallundae TaxID=86028 RepID=A0ABR4D0X2_9HELO
MTDFIPYEIVNTEAQEAVDLIKDPRYSVKGLAEPGPPDESFMGDARKKLPYEMRAMVLVKKFLPGPRTIRVIYDSIGEHWTYRCKSPPNQVPFVIHGLKDMMAPLARNILKPAPFMGLDQYPWFNYATDTIFFEYLSCEATSEGNPKYVAAMKEVSAYLRDHNKDKLQKPVRQIKITWCHNESRPQPILDRFRGIRHLEKITLVAHDHYTDAFPDKDEEVNNESDEDSDQDNDDVVSEPEDTSAYNYEREHEVEPVDMRAMVRAGDLNGSSGKRTAWRPYRFEVELIDHNGEPVLYWDDEDAYHDAN